MRIKVLFDKEALTPEFATGWGISLLLNNHTLFDTGEKFEYLEKNARLMKVDLAKINKVIISHQHWDHTGGLWRLLEANRKITVYGCPNFDREFKEKVAAMKVKWQDVVEGLQIDDGIYSCGQNFVNYKGTPLVEQVVAIDGKDKVHLVCGCCHPGILNMIEKAKHHFRKNVGMAIGGLHLIDSENRFINYVAERMHSWIDGVASAHCTGYYAISLLHKLFKDKFVALKVGTELEV